MIDSKFRMLLDLANCNLRLELYDEAEMAARTVFAHDGWPDDKQYRHFRAQVFIGRSLMGQARLDEAEIELLAAYEGLVSEQASTDDVTQAINFLAELYDQKSDSDKAEKWRSMVPQEDSET
jgi:hypothetical protein